MYSAMSERSGIEETKPAFCSATVLVSIWSQLADAEVLAYPHRRAVHGISNVNSRVRFMPGNRG
jgi:hypothetical protein